MISRLTLSAAVFATLAAATLTFAAESHQQQLRTPVARSAVAAPAAVVVMPRVEITGRRAR